MRPLAATLLFALVAAGCGGSGGGRDVARSKLPTLVLQPADVASPFTQFDGGPQGAADNPPGPRSDPARFGREGGWKARYRRGGTQQTSGPLVIESRADLFDSSDGAKSDLDAYRKQYESSAAGFGADARVLEGEAIGDESLGLTILQRGSPSVRFFNVAWRDGNVTGSIAVNGFDGKLVLAQALKLARAQERRIRAAAAS